MKSIQDALGEVLGRLADGAAPPRVWGPLWTQAVGATVAAHAQPVTLAQGLLTVRCDSMAWRMALERERAVLLGRVQAVFGASTVRDVAFEAP